MQLANYSGPGLEDCERYLQFPLVRFGKSKEKRGKRKEIGELEKKEESTRAVGQNPTHHQLAQDLLGGPKSTDPQLIDL